MKNRVLFLFLTLAGCAGSPSSGFDSICGFRQISAGASQVTVFRVRCEPVEKDAGK